MSRTVRFHETGGPDVLKIEDIETPYPGRGEVRIAVKAIGINRSESMYRSGVYVIAPNFPAILGYEAAGVIEAIGPDVLDLAVGDIISTTPAFSYADYGMYGELVVAPAQAVVKHPHGLSTEKAAATWVSYLTAWGALIDVARLERGDFVLIPAASSSVGLAAIQIARQVGAIPIALTRTSAKLAALKDLGAVHVIATGESDLVAEVMRVTDGSGARVVFDPVGGPTFERLAEATAMNGTMVVYGALSNEATPFPLFASVVRHLTIRGFEIGEVAGNPEKLASAVEFVSEGLETGAFDPKIDRTFPFEQIVEAHRYLESNQQIGKVVVTL